MMPFGSAFQHQLLRLLLPCCVLSVCTLSRNMGESRLRNQRDTEVEAFQGDDDRI